MKKLLVLLFSLLASFNSYGGQAELDFSLDTFCDKSPKAQVRNVLFYLPNQEEPYSGENLCVYLSNGQYYSRGDIKKGLREGDWTYWKENGQRKKVKYYQEGEIVGGINFVYFDNGKIFEEIGYFGEKYSFGRNLDGEYNKWFENGQKLIEHNYNNGIPEGKWTSWFENGLQSGEGNFKDGTGQFIDFYENTQKSYEVVYQDGIGKETYWYESGQIWFEINYKDGKLDGKSTYWDENGQIDLEEIYKDDELVSEINHKAEREADRELAEQKAQAEAARELAEDKAREEEILAQEIAKKFKVKEAEEMLIAKLEAERTAQQLAFEKEQYNRLLNQEVQAEQDQERLLVIEDLRNTLKSAYVSNIAARVKSFWRYQGAEDDWTAEVYIVQDRDGTVVAVDVRNANVDDSSKAKVFKDSIRRAVYKASPLPSAPDEAVFDRELIFIFGVN